MKFKTKLILALLILLAIAGGYVYFKYFFTYGQRERVKRSLDNITGQNLTVTVFSYDGKVLRSWINVKKIVSSREGNNYTYFYTKDDKYVQIPNSVCYVAEEE